MPPPLRVPPPPSKPDLPPFELPPAAVPPDPPTTVDVPPVEDVRPPIALPPGLAPPAAFPPDERPPVPDWPGELLPLQPTTSPTIVRNSEDFVWFFILFPTRIRWHRHHRDRAEGTFHSGTLWVQELNTSSLVGSFAPTKQLTLKGDFWHSQAQSRNA